MRIQTGAHPGERTIAAAATHVASTSNDAALRPALREVARERARIQSLPPAVFFLGMLLPLAAVPIFRLAWTSQPPERTIGFLFAVLFVATGALLVGSAARSWLARTRLHATPAAEAWRFDREWGQRDIDDGVAAGAARMLAAIAGTALFLTPFHLLAPVVRGESAAWVLFLVLGIFDLALIVALGSALRRLGRRIGYGRCVVRLASTPACTGDELVLDFSASHALQARADLRAELLCIREGPRPGPRSDDAPPRVFGVLFESAQMFTTDTNGRARLRFAVPADAPPTSFTRPPHIYWELVVSTTSRDDDYEGIFLLPVY